jgi:hypothetical protein
MAEAFVAARRRLPSSTRSASCRSTPSTSAIASTYAAWSSHHDVKKGREFALRQNGVTVDIVRPKRLAAA